MSFAKAGCGCTIDHQHIISCNLVRNFFWNGICVSQNPSSTYPLQYQIIPAPRHANQFCFFWWGAPCLESKGDNEADDIDEEEENNDKDQDEDDKEDEDNHEDEAQDADKDEEEDSSATYIE